MGGPIWLGSLFDSSFVTELITSIEQASEDSYAYRDRMLRMLYVVKEELSNSLYFDNAKLARIMHTDISQNKLIRSALLNAGYRVSTSHARQDSTKTNAPHYIIWNIMCAFAEQSSTKRAATERLNIDSPYYRLLTKKSTIQFDQMIDLITSTSGKLHKLVMAFAFDSMNGSMNGNTFLKEFKAPLSTLDNQITILAQPANPTTTAEPSSLSKFM
jgi:hypothetical protein